MSFWTWLKRALKTPTPKPTSRIGEGWDVDHTPWCGPLKDQGDTMECTAYAVTSCMEWWSRKNGKPVNFDPRAAFARQGSANTSLALINGLRRGINGYVIEDYVPVTVDSVRREIEKSPIICDMLITPAFKMGYDKWERHAVLMVACNETHLVLQNSWPAKLDVISWELFMISKPECYRVTGIKRM